MGHKHNRHNQKKHKDGGSNKPQRDRAAQSRTNVLNRLELVLKCDSEGSLEAIIGAVEGINIPDVELSVVSSGVGEINKNDLLMAGTAGRIILGYEVEVNKAFEEEIYKNGVEIRLYNVIYRLVDDLKKIGERLAAAVENELILGRAKVIKLFKSCRKGIILGCDVLEGRISRGDRFRVIGAMGQLYSGKVGSLYIEKDAVDSAVKGQKVGLKIENFQKAHIGDIVECIKRSSRAMSVWEPVSGITRIN